MAWKTLVSDRADWLRDTNAMLVSACCHFAMLIAVALVSVVGAGGGDGTKLVVSLGKGDDRRVSPIADDSPLEGDGKTVDRSPLAGGPPSRSGTWSGECDGSGPAVHARRHSPRKPRSTWDRWSCRRRRRQSSGSIGGLASAGRIRHARAGVGGGTGLGGGQKGEGSSGKAATEFFGIGGYGQSFVYVVDCSGSMNQNGKFERARYELLQSIEQLNKDQSYFVIFYNHEAHPMDGGRLVLATPAHIAETTQWVNYVEAEGGTNPLPALLYALSLHPDAIYFLSDGQFDPNTIQEIRLRNRPNNRLKTRQIPIHTIAFYDRFAAGLMRQIARNSGGEFKFVQ